MAMPVLHPLYLWYCIMQNQEAEVLSKEFLEQELELRKLETAEFEVAKVWNPRSPPLVALLPTSRMAARQPPLSCVPSPCPGHQCSDTCLQAALHGLTPLHTPHTSTRALEHVPLRFLRSFSVPVLSNIDALCARLGPAVRLCVRACSWVSVRAADVHCPWHLYHQMSTARGTYITRGWGFSWPQRRLDRR